MWTEEGCVRIMPIVEKNMERAKEDKEQNGCKQKRTAREKLCDKG